MITKVRVAFCLAVSYVSFAASPPAKFEWQATDSSVALLNAGKIVWQCQYGKDLTHPMFHPLALTDGTVLTSNAPPDHPWHHGHWFSWKYLNHANYWEGGRDKEPDGITRWSDVAVTRRPNFGAAIRMNLTYHEAGKPVVLIEHREIEISPPAENGEYHLDWKMVFTAQDQDVAFDRTPIPGEPHGQPFGGYAGLSIRFAKDLVEWGAMTTNGPVPQDPLVPHHSEKGAVGIDFSGLIAGREAGVAILDYPTNLHSPTPWDTVMNHEKTMSFEQAALLFFEPYVLQHGQSFTLRYRVTVHSGRWNADHLTASQAEYVKQVDKRK